ncbi:MAG: hypothetical protein QXU98_13650, partial [Candidatus Parvarchaeota archaeon]
MKYSGFTHRIRNGSGNSLKLFFPVFITILIVTSSLVISLQLSPSPVAGNSSKSDAVNSSMKRDALNNVSLSGTNSLLNSTVSVRNGTIVGDSKVPAFYGYTDTPGNGGFTSGFYNTTIGTRYPVIEPYSSSFYNKSATYPFEPWNGSPIQTVVNYLPPQYFSGNIYNYDGLYATSLHFIANFTKIYVPVLYNSYKNNPPGMGPNYSLQFNAPFYSAVPGGSNMSWFQSVIEFITTSGAGNSSDPNGSYYLVPSNQWWENFTKYENVYTVSSNDYKDPDVFVNPENPLIVSNWLNISFSDGNTTIYSFTRISGFMAFDGPAKAMYSAYHRDTVWFNSTTVIPHGNQKNPWPFPYFDAAIGVTQAAGIAFVGSGSGQVVWGNYTATFGVVQDVAGNLLPLSGVESAPPTGENSYGDNGIVILDSEYNPLGLPPYTPYTYQSNSSGGPLGTSSYNANHESAAATLIAGTIFPANASVTAYAVDTHSYIPVVKNGSSFYVDYPGLYGMNSSYVIIGGLSLDYWSPVILNFSAPGFKGASVTIYPYGEMYPYIEFRIVNAILVPINEKMVYGYLSFPFSYFSYFASKYIFRVDPNIKYLTGSALMQKIWPFSAASSSYFYLNVSAGSSYFNASQYMPYITSLLLSLVWVNRTGYPSYYESSYGWAFFGSPISIPYSIVVPSSISSLNVNAPLIEGIVSVPPGSGAYEYNISLMSFNVSLTVDLSSLPESYNSTAPTVSSVSFNGKTVWSGNSTNPVFVLNIPLSQMTLYDEQPLIYNLIQGMSFEDADPYYNLTLNITPSSS